MIDLHCHVDLYPDPTFVVEQCRLNKVYVVSVTNTPAAFRGTAALARECDTIETALGLHPQLAGERAREVELFDQHLPQVKWVGEIGLDGTPEHRAAWQSQVCVFEHILRSCGTAGGRLLSIHSRAAATAVLDTLRRYPDAGVPVLHWFSGTLGELEAAVQRNCWFSVGLPMLRSKKGRSITTKIPRDRILTETDGPFVDWNGKPAHPWDVAIVESELASLWQTTREEADRVLHANLANLTKKLAA